MDYLNDSIKELAKNINAKKDAVIIDALKANGIDFDLESEKYKRFKSLTVETQGDKETWYYNDGSKDGLRIITFETVKPDFRNMSNTLEWNLKYY